MKGSLEMQGFWKRKKGERIKGAFWQFVYEQEKEKGKCRAV